MKGDISCDADKSDIYTKPGMICPVVRYAPKHATMPSIAAQPLNLSASGVMSLYLELIVNCELNFILE